MLHKEKIRTKIKLDILEQNNHGNEDGVERLPCEPHWQQQQLFHF
jgi:hypothetical protein